MAKSCHWKVKGVKTAPPGDFKTPNGTHVYEVTGDPADIVDTWVSSKEAYLEHFSVPRGSNANAMIFALDKNVITQPPMSAQDEALLGSAQWSNYRMAANPTRVGVIKFWFACAPCVKRALLARQRNHVAPVVVRPEIQNIHLTQNIDIDITVENDKAYIEVDMVDLGSKDHTPQTDILRRLTTVQQAWK